MYKYIYEDLFDNSPILKATYEVLIPYNNGLWPLRFRWDLGNILNEDENKVLQRYELKLIKEGWIVQKRAGELIRPSEKLMKIYANK